VLIPQPHTSIPAKAGSQPATRPLVATQAMPIIRRRLSIV
jgi:hypothetical protein